MVKFCHFVKNILKIKIKKIPHFLEKKLSKELKKKINCQNHLKYEKGA
jgi:hypothetical protein